MPKDKSKFTTIRVSRETHAAIQAATVAESARVGYPVAMEWYVRRAVEEKEARDAKGCPDMLTSLKALASHLEIWLEKQPYEGGAYQLIANDVEQARAIIRQAEGRG